MIRIVRTPSGLVVDEQQRLPGRGAYVHRDPECMTKAVKHGGLARTLRRPVPPTLLDSARK